MRSAGVDGSASSRSRGVVLGWALLFALTVTLTALTAEPLLEGSRERPATDRLLVLRAIEVARTSTAASGGRVRLEDVFAAYSSLAEGRPASRGAVQALLLDLVQDGLVARTQGSFQLTPEGSALLEGED